MAESNPEQSPATDHAQWRDLDGQPAPLGVSRAPDGASTNFALYSKHASAVELRLYARHELQRPLVRRRLRGPANRTGRVWHCRLPDEVVGDARYYGYVVWGPERPEAGHRFDSDKILLDPYAHAVFFPPGFSRRAASRPGSNEGRAPLGVLHVRPRSSEARQEHQRPLHHSHDAVIYELHVREFTRHPSSGVAAHKRGTYAGLADKIPYLADLGVTAVELMPVFQADPQEGSHWGYMPLSFFSPHHGYACRQGLGEQFAEFRQLVHALHRAGIEVLLDVVYNHTTEGDQRGPTYSYRGLDNTTYYLLGRDPRRYRNDAGTGNVLHTANRYVRNMILDSMRFWAKHMHVDGFRFDLASLFTRRGSGAIDLEAAPIIEEITSDPDLAGTRLIAEAWDVSSYQLGRSFPGITWYQWNGRFRDCLRSFVRGDAGRVGELMTRLYGSDDLFPDRGSETYHPYQSINYITSHDGFSLYDLVAYNRKHNWANGHGNRDGMDENLSWNCGHEGDAGAPAEVLALRRRQVKNFVCLLLLANGTPMLRAGDEFLRTQGGNNNPYNQDNPTTWLDWRRLEQHRDIQRFFRRLIHFRRDHPTLCRGTFWRQAVRWYGPRGRAELEPESRCLAYFLSGAELADLDLYVMINADNQPQRFHIQQPPAAGWRVTIDTAATGGADFHPPGSGPQPQAAAPTLAPRSVQVLTRGHRP